MLRTRLSVFFAAACLGIIVAAAYAQEGRPALAVETAEDARVKQVLSAAMPRDLLRWTVESESRVDGVTSFHDGNEAVTTPFRHEFTISYKRTLTEAERAGLLADSQTEAGIRRMLAASQCEVQLATNTFDDEVHAPAPLGPSSRAPFTLALVSDVETRLYLGPWTSGSPERDGDQLTFHPKASRNRAAPGAQIQTLSMRLACAPTAADEILSKTNLPALAALVGQNVMPMPQKHALPAEKPLSPVPPGANVVSFTIDGGDLHQHAVQLKPSKDRQFAYLNNFYPDYAVTDNAVTRVLASEDDDFATKNKSGFLDITMPLLRTTGTFDVGPDMPKATLSGGINCWDACEWSFDAKAVTVTVTRYDPVNGFVEGTFSGTVTLGYKVSEPVDHRETTATLTGGVFKVRRRADRK